MSKPIPLDTIPEMVPGPEPSMEELQSVPAGAFALAGLAVGLLLVGWLFIYFFVFLPRGPVG